MALHYYENGSSHCASVHVLFCMYAISITNLEYMHTYTRIYTRAGLGLLKDQLHTHGASRRLEHMHLEHMHTYTHI
jgi:hypothetical protein